MAGVQGATTPPWRAALTSSKPFRAEDFVFEDVGGSDLNILQSDAEAGNFEFDGGGGPLTVGGANETACDQKADQSGSASG